MTTEKTAFFQRVEALCKDRSMTTTDLGPAAGIGNGTVTGWRRGASPRISSVAKAAAFFNVSVAYLMGETDDPIDYKTVDTSDFHQPAYDNFLKMHKGNVELANRQYLEVQKQAAQDAMNDPDRLAIYNHGENSWAIGNAHAPVKVINGKEHPLSEQEAELLRIFADLDVMEQARVLLYAADIKNGK